MNLRRNGMLGSGATLRPRRLTDEEREDERARAYHHLIELGAGDLVEMLGLADPLPDLLTASEVAHLFGVEPKTVWRWCHTGRIRCLRTPGGRSRYDRAAVWALLDDNQPGLDDGCRTPPAGCFRHDRAAA